MQRQHTATFCSNVQFYLLIELTITFKVLRFLQREYPNPGAQQLAPVVAQPVAPPPPPPVVPQVNEVVVIGAQLPPPPPPPEYPGDINGDIPDIDH